MLSFAADVGVPTTRSTGTTVLGLTVKECLPLPGSASFAKSFVAKSDDLFVVSVLKNRQTAAQSSTLDVG
jgi:hypothetical protein